MSNVPPVPIYIDVDDTLVRSFGSKRIPMGSMVSVVRALKERGADLYLWSTGGAAYAEATAKELDITDCFKAFLPKPSLLIDDLRVSDWGLLALHPAECASMTAEEILERASQRSTSSP